jgi:hypothetical protein
MDVMGGAMGATNTPTQPRILKDGTVIQPTPAQQVPKQSQHKKTKILNALFSF